MREGRRCPQPIGPGTVKEPILLAGDPMRETVALHAGIISPHNKDTNRTREAPPR